MAQGSTGRMFVGVALGCLAVGGVAYGVARHRLQAQQTQGAASSSASTSAAPGGGDASAADATIANVDAGAGVAADAIAQASDAGEGDGFVGYTVDLEDAAQPDAATQIDVDFLTELVPMEPRTPEKVAWVKKLLSERRINISQGNPKAIHKISRAQCLKGLEGQVLQTTKQREICGHENEVPVYANGDIDSAKVCIDQFEYPNHPCMLPFVFSNPINSAKLCELAGKRLCKDEEWNTACDADPAGGKPWQYAYGDTLDMTACHVGVQWLNCLPNKDIWGTCPTQTEPSGAFPRCKSRLGVFDQHGNIAEFMSRLDPNDHVTYIQMKGSAWFYDGKMYKDHCRFDPRWHVDPIDRSWHANYHLGSRCCRDVVPLKDRGKAGAVDAGPMSTDASADVSVDAIASDATSSDARADGAK